jgi:predicted enzyme related to lactoylglutathione lyase
VTGAIVWHELFTDDVDEARSFFPELLGVELETADMGEFRYSMLKKDGRTHAGFVLKPEEGGDIPNHWYPYVQVDDVDATLAKATELGVEAYLGPMEPTDGLRIAVLADLQKATFGVMSWGEERPTGLFVWDELHATDTAAAATFYARLVGWTTEPFMEGYEAFNSGESTVGGLMQERGGSRVAYWLTYFGVDDTDAAAAKAMELGAGVIVPPESMEGVGRYAVLTDPTGAAFGLHQP